MDKAKYKITVGEAATKGAKLANGGATVRSWGVVIINTETGDKQTAAQIITAEAAKATDNKDAARCVKNMSRDFGGIYVRRTAAVLAASKAAAALGDNYYLDRKLDLEAAKEQEEVYIKAAAERHDSAIRRRWEKLTPEQRKAAELRAAIKEIRARAAAEIGNLRIAAALGTF